MTKHIKESELTPIIKQLTDYLDCETAKKTETDNILIYKNRGWNILNKTLGGEIGSTGKKWTFEECQKEAMGFNTRSKFNNKKRSVYNCAKRNGWLDDICDHMIKINTNRTEKDCKNIALRYKSKSDFYKNNKADYIWARRQGILDEICLHMIRKYKPNKYWTYNRCAEEALKYTKRSQFSLNSCSCASIAKRNGWYENICAHMPIITKPMNYWNYERCKEEALKYYTMRKFNKKSGGAYASARRNGWLKEITLHMNKQNL